MSDRKPNAGRSLPQPLAVILGTNEIASAVAVHLHRADYGVVLSHDPLPPVIRRKMAFHDALFNDVAQVEGVTAERADTGLEILAQIARRRGVAITHLGLLDIIVLRPIDVLVDARMQKYTVMPDLRRLAKTTIGLGPGFCAGANCDVAIETQPDAIGLILKAGETERPDRTAPKLGNKGGERFVYSSHAGRWHTAIEIGSRVFKDYFIGNLEGSAITAPFDGILRGVVRDDTEVPAGVKLLEIDARGRRATWTGIDMRGRKIARAVMKAIAIGQTKAPAKPAATIYLVE